MHTQATQATGLQIGDFAKVTNSGYRNFGKSGEVISTTNSESFPVKLKLLHGDTDVFTFDYVKVARLLALADCGAG